MKRSYTPPLQLIKFSYIGLGFYGIYVFEILASCNSNVLIPSRTASEKQDTENGIPNLVDDWWSPETASLAPDVLPLGTNQETVASFPASEVRIFKLNWFDLVYPISFKNFLVLCQKEHG